MTSHGSGLPRKRADVGFGEMVMKLERGGQFFRGAVRVKVPECEGCGEVMEERVQLWGRSCCVFMAQGRSVRSLPPRPRSESACECADGGGTCGRSVRSRAGLVRGGSRSFSVKWEGFTSRGRDGVHPRDRGSVSEKKDANGRTGVFIGNGVRPHTGLGREDSRGFAQFLRRD